MIQPTDTFNNCDVLHGYYKSELGENKSYLLFLFQRYYHDKKQQYQDFKHFLYGDKKHFQLYLLFRIKYSHYVLQKSTVHLYM
jgi:hypothetical protein